MVSDTGMTADTWFLDGYCQEAAEESFDSCASVVVLFELLGSIRDLIADVVGYTPEVVAAFLMGKLWVCSGTEEQVLRFGSIKERASVLDVGDTMDRHPAMAVHGEIRWADYLLIIARESIFVLSVSRVVWDEGASIKAIDDVLEEWLRVVFRVAGYGFELQAECLDGGFQ